MLNLTLRPFATGSMICRSPQKQLVALPPPEAAAGVTLHPPEVGTPAQHGGAGEDGTDDGSIAELGIKLFPCLPRDQAASALWVGFVNDAKTCIKQYNIKHKVSCFIYCIAPSSHTFRYVGYSFISTCRLSCTLLFLRHLFDQTCASTTSKPRMHCCGLLSVKN